MLDLLWELISDLLGAGDAADVADAVDAPVAAGTGDASLADGAQPKFGMAISAGETENGDPVVWSTADKAGGALYNGRTGARVE